MAVYLILAAVTIAIGFFVDSKVEKYDKSFFEEPNRSKGERSSSAGGAQVSPLVTKNA